MVVDMETEDGLKRRAVMVVAKKIGLACADLLYYRTNNIHFYYVDRTKITPGRRKKCCKYYGPVRCNARLQRFLSEYIL